VYSWGGNNFGQLGYHTDDDKTDDNGHPLPNLPMKVDMLSRVKIVQVACRSMMSLFRTDDGKLFSCGTMETLQLGYEAEMDQFIPAQITALDAVKVVKCVVHDLDCMAITDEDQVYVWGHGFEASPALIPWPQQAEGETPFVGKSPCVKFASLGNGVVEFAF
jgi:alpha-tubulin suppressor-like RCC1 family protein